VGLEQYKQVLAAADVQVLQDESQAKHFIIEKSGQNPSWHLSEQVLPFLRKY